MYKIPRDFQLQLRRINTPSHTPHPFTYPTPLHIPHTPSHTPHPFHPLLQSHLIYFICCYIFVNFRVAMDLAYFLCQAMALVCFFQKRKCIKKYVNDHSFDTIGEGRIYANDGSKCPVVCFKKYISKLNPNQDSLWQRPKQNVSENDSTWYCNVPYGEKHLGSMLSHMSLKYNLSQRYTNHSLRVTSLKL